MSTKELYRAFGCSHYSPVDCQQEDGVFVLEMECPREKCFADFRLTSWNVCWSLAITERLSPMSNQRKRVNDSGEEQVAILRAMAGSNAVTGRSRASAFVLRHLEKPRDNRLTLTYPPVSLRTGLCWEATRASERCRRQVL